MDITKLYKIYRESNGVSTDTRTILPGQIYFALKGPRFNGNAHASNAIKKGASYVVIDESAYHIDQRYILVEDVLSQLQMLAVYHRQQFDKPVIGITGSNGKTTTKELVNAILSTKYDVNTTKGNLNNHIGVPLTILQGRLQQDAWIVEMGTNAPGEIEFLSDMVTPDIALITNIGAAHLEKLQNLEGVFKEKTSLFDTVDQAGGTIFINSDDPYLKNYREVHSTIVRYSIDLCGYGSLLLKESSPYLQLNLSADKDYHVQSQLVGSYNRINVSAAMTIGHHLGISVDQTVNAIMTYSPDNMRSQMLNTNTNQIVVDSYNANPSSMKESINSFVKMNPDNALLILGDMLELGIHSKEYHKEIINLIEGLGVDHILVGPHFQSLSAKAYQSVDLLKDDIVQQNKVIKHKTILLKASRSIKLEELLVVL